MTPGGFKTGRDLLRDLQSLPDADLDLVVMTEGCDCEGFYGGIVKEEGHYTDKPNQTVLMVNR